jgi:DNA-binding CsgD family transcriptional regulator
LRAVLFDETSPWGALTLLRAADQRAFAPAEVALVDSAAGLLADGLRRAMLMDSLPQTSANPDEAAGLVILAADYTIMASDAVADRWLAELTPRGDQAQLPTPLRAVAGAARHSAGGACVEPALARARVLSACGQWLVIRGTMLGPGPAAQTAVLIEPARSHELAPLAAAVHGLTARERAVSQLVARGYPTAVIAEQLHVSAWTVQDYLKSIFDKVGVGSRGELVARLFFTGGGPRLTE